MTIQEVARRAGVSIATVSRTVHNSPRVNPATAARVRRVMEELGYRPNRNAQSLVSGRSRILGLVVSDITNPFFPELIQGFEDVAQRDGYDVLVASTRYDRARLALAVGRMIDRQIEGVAIMTSELDESLTTQFADRSVPLVFLDVGKVGEGVSNIRVDYAQGIMQAVNHLLDLGHNRIAFISGPADLKSARVRRKAFLKCLEQHGLPELVEQGDHKVAGGLEAMARLLGRKEAPTAVLTSNDLTAFGALRGIRQAGLRIPEDISVIGFDDIDMARFTDPPLTTVRLSRSEVACMAYHALLKSIGGDRAGSESRIETQLVVRESTARVRPSAPPRKIVSK